eukprot:183512-Pleurochrysis_carterae.AAC.4
MQSLIQPPTRTTEDAFYWLTLAALPKTGRAKRRKQREDENRQNGQHIESPNPTPLAVQTRVGRASAFLGALRLAHRRVLEEAARHVVVHEEWSTDHARVVNVDARRGHGYVRVSLQCRHGAVLAVHCVRATKQLAGRLLAQHELDLVARLQKRQHRRQGGCQLYMSASNRTTAVAVMPESATPSERAMLPKGTYTLCLSRISTVLDKPPAATLRTQ